MIAKDTVILRERYPSPLDQGKAKRILNQAWPLLTVLVKATNKGDNREPQAARSVSLQQEEEWSWQDKSLEKANLASYTDNQAAQKKPTEAEPLQA